MAINIEDDIPKPRRNLLVPPVLDSLGVDELGQYIVDLEAEIVRVKAVITAKDAHKTAAAALFAGPRQKPRA